MLRFIDSHRASQTQTNADKRKLQECPEFIRADNRLGGAFSGAEVELVATKDSNQELQYRNSAIIPDPSPVEYG